VLFILSSYFSLLSSVKPFNNFVEHVDDVTSVIREKTASENSLRSEIYVTIVATNFIYIQ